MGTRFGLAAVVLALVLAGCGGQSGSPVDQGGNTGSVRLRVRWGAANQSGAQARYVAAAANSVKVIVSYAKGGAPIKTVVASRTPGDPETTVVVSALPSGRLYFAGAAYTNGDGTGYKVGSGLVYHLVEAGATTTLPLRLESAR